MENDNKLISQTLRAGDCVQIGRKATCTVSVRSPFISGFHCLLEIPNGSSACNATESQSSLCCTVTDQSSNGTWLICQHPMRMKTEKVCDDTAVSQSLSKTRKLMKGKKEEVHVGDRILLLAPSHSACKLFQFTLTEAVAGKGEYILQQLSPSEEARHFLSTEESCGIAGTVSKAPSLSTGAGSTALPALAISPSLVANQVGEKITLESALPAQIVVKAPRLMIKSTDVSSTVNKCLSDGMDPAHLSSSSTAADTPLCKPEKIGKSSADARTPSPQSKEVSAGCCPICQKLFPISELSTHSAACQTTVKEDGSDSEEGEREGDPDIAKDEVDLPRLATTPSPKYPLSKAASMEQCPKCLNVFLLTDLICHSDTCTGECRLEDHSSLEAEDLDSGILGDPDLSVMPVPSLSKYPSLEQCPFCLKSYPLCELVAHSELCSDSRSSEVCEREGLGRERLEASKAVVSSTRWSDMEGGKDHLNTMAAATDEANEVRGEWCPHGCEVERDGSRRYDLEPAFPAGVRPPLEAGIHNPETDVSTRAKSASCSGDKETSLGAAIGSLGQGRGEELEQCMHCLENFTVVDLVSHAECCPMKDKSKCIVEEHCPQCLKIFPLDELVAHSLNCSSKGISSDIADTEDGTGSQERCMHCFQDFSIGHIVEHSMRCTGDLLGPRERFKGFLPSIHDVDPMALGVLNDTQMAAVAFVIEKSKKASERLYPSLKDRVTRLGYTEKDLDSTLQWVRREAPIIIHVRLDFVLKFLVKDTHYRSRFETGTSGGSTDLRARSSWENRIFNKIYAHSPPVDRVKYGVLNIVGDPRGVRSCASYGDSFLQLKKVRLRTTFASADTSSGTVKLSCCEYYGNVLHEYSDQELRAILEVATRKKSFLRSDVISQYKEVQIHGPVCLSENVDCIVVNERHSVDTELRKLLDTFVEANGCNLIWMEPDSIDNYPALDVGGTPSTGFASPLTTYPTPSIRRRRRRHRDYYYGGSRYKRRRWYMYEDDEYVSDEEDEDEYEYD